jgi:oxygen-independent coproporphyrinogen-3 oxidase
MLSLYVHIPFCVKKCLYCGFYSTQYSQEHADEFLSGLRSEAVLFKDAFHGRVFDTIYIGGGTPTVLSSDQFSCVLDIIRGHFQVSNDCEFTVEANPNTVSEQKLKTFLERGVNRLSLGVQSFSDTVLRVLGRLHTSEEAIVAVTCAKQAGFRNIGMDLIYGIPGQTVSLWRESFERAIELRPEHISAYSLSLDEGAWFTREVEAGRFALPAEETVAEMYELAVSALARAGYQRYEISNFSLPGFECRHNMNYWKRGEYLGLGPGAWSFLSGKRCSNIPDVREYSQRLSTGSSPVGYEEAVRPEQAAAEALMLGLRMEAGIELRGFEQEHGRHAADRLAKKAGPLGRTGLVSLSSGRLRLTGRGILLSDDVIGRLCT